MSDYYYDDDRAYHRRSRPTREYSPGYVREETYIARGSREAPPSGELVYRGRREDDSVEDIRREFPPPRGSDYPPRRARSARSRRESYYDDDGYSEYGSRRDPRDPRGWRRDRYDDRYDNRYDSRYDDGHDSDEHDRPPRRERRKSRVEQFAEDIGLGGLVGAVTGSARSRSRSRHDRHRGYDSEGDLYYDRKGRARSKSRDTAKKWQQAATAAAIAGAVEAFRTRKMDGPWKGEKGRRIATTALSAAGINGLIDKDPEDHSKRHVAESVVGGLVTNRIANGKLSRSQSRPRDDSRSRSRSRSRGRSLSRVRSIFSRSKSRGRDDDIRDNSRSPKRSRSRSRSRVAALATAGGIAAAGKALYDRVRSKSRGRDRSRSRSSSEDSYVPSRRQRYRGGRSRSRGYSPGDSYVDDDKVARPRGRAAGADPNYHRDQSTSSISTSDLETQRRKRRGKELITAGLATVATIHAAHGVYSSMEASEKRHKAVMEGEMSPAQARKLKSKNMLQDAAAVGIAGLGIKSAFTEWKGMNEQRRGIKEIEEKHRKRQKRKQRRAREIMHAGPHGSSRYIGGGYYSEADPYGYTAHPGGNYYPPPPTTYQDGNPYGSTVPPPPAGPPPTRY